MLSDKVLNVPELGEEGLLFAKAGFNVIGTANTRDKGVNEMSSALKRRFNFETVMPVRDVALEKQIIINEVDELAKPARLICQWMKMWQRYWLLPIMSFGKEYLRWGTELTVRRL